MRRLASLADGALEAGWLSSVLLVPLFIDKATSQVFEPAKAGVLRAIALWMLAAWACKALCIAEPRATQPADDASKTARLTRLANTPVFVATLAVIATTVLSTLLSLAPSESFWGHSTRAQGTLTLLAQVAIFAATLANLSTRAQLRRFITAIILPSLPIALYALFQRFGLEPLNITARETELRRVTSLLGQPVFLGAYLSMVMPFTAYRLIKVYSEHAASPALRSVALGSYGALVLLQGTAVLLTESRGPVLSLCAGLAVGVLCLAAHRGMRRTVFVLWGAAGVVALLFALGAPSRIADDARDVEQARMARRAAETFAVTGGGGQFRLTTWQVAERVFKNREPLELADGSRDPHAALRKMVGYGPELQYAVTPPFYDAELTRLFGYFIIDRFHNDLWDTLITCGLFGLCAWLALQMALLRLAVYGLGLVPSRERSRALWLALAGGAASGAIVAVALRGMPFLLLGLQGGLVLGVVLFLSGVALFSRPLERPIHPAREGLMVAAVAAIVSHVIESSFSFTVVPTGALFWVACALAVVAAREPIQDEALGPTNLQPQGHVTHAPLAGGALLGLAMVVLGHSFIGGTTISSRPGAVVWAALTTLNQPLNQRFPAVAIIVLATLLFGTLFLGLDAKAEARKASFGPYLTVALSTACAVAVVYWLRIGFVLSRLALPTTNKSVIVERTLEIRSAATNSFYVACLLLAMLFAFAASRPSPVPQATTARIPAWRLFGAMASIVVALVLFIPCSLNPAHADAAVAVGDSFKQQNQLALSEEAYKRATEMSPHVDAYRSLLAKVQVARARAEPTRAAEWLKLGDQTFVEAVKLNPAASELAVNIALTRGNRAQRASGAERAELTVEAGELYRRAIRLHPQDPAVLRAWSGLLLNLAQNPPAALEMALRALPLDPSNATAHALIGDCKARLAGSKEGEERRRLFLEAAAAYEQARTLAPTQVIHRVNEGRAYLEAGERERAIPLLRSALSSVPASSRVGQSTAALLRRAEGESATSTAAVTP